MKRAGWLIPVLALAAALASAAWFVAALTRPASRAPLQPPQATPAPRPPAKLVAPAIEKAPAPPAAPPVAASGASFRLGLPVACEIGRTCFIQNYVDADPRALESRDYACGAATYDGHTGTDFRVLSTEAATGGVVVLAAAAGTVKALRDGMRDHLIPARRPALIAGAACGNGVLIEHGDGWETQYCHLLQGSVRIKEGDAVRAGDPLGLVGYSGNAAFAHLHLTVRRGGEVLDPFTGRAPDGACSREVPASGLWREDVAARLAYAPGRIIETGFADAPIRPVLLEQGRAAVPAPTARSGELYVFARVMHARTGDRLHLELSGPSGLKAEHSSEPVASPKAIYVAYFGRKRPGWSWRVGRYEGKATLVREGREIDMRSFTMELK
jgi:murein DD-endopeptidase MepM/ murein hydrolase activator NlpD